MATGTSLDIKDLADYRLEASLGKGHYGTVHKATHKLTNRKVAVKKLKENKHLDAEAIPLLLDLAHKNVIKLICVCQERREGSRWHLVMELCATCLLKYMEGVEGVLKRETQVNLRWDVMAGLEYLHRRRIAHRDIKPNNILLSSGDPSSMVAKLADFGLAKIVDIAHSYMETRAGNTFWMAPELFECDTQPYKMSIDIWSCGKLFFYLAIDKFNRERLAVFMCGMNPEHEGIKLYGAGIDTWLKRLVESMMLRSAKDRLSAKQVLHELEIHDTPYGPTFCAEPRRSTTLSGTPLATGSDESRNYQCPPLLVTGGVVMQEEDVIPNRRISHLLHDGQWRSDDMELAVPDPLTAPVLCRTGRSQQASRRTFLAVQGMDRTTLLYDVNRCRIDREFGKTGLARRHFGLVECGNAVYAIGGVTGSGTGSDSILAEMEVLNMSSKRWEPAEPCPFKNAFPIVASAEGLLYVIENTCAFNVKRLGRPRANIKMAVYDTMRKEWEREEEQLPAWIQSTAGASSVFVDGGLCVVGGEDSVCARYDTVDCKWKKLPRPESLHSFGACLGYKKSVLLCGGFGSNGSIEAFDTVKKKWRVWDAKMSDSLKYHFVMV